MEWEHTCSFFAFLFIFKFNKFKELEQQEVQIEEKKDSVVDQQVGKLDATNKRSSKRPAKKKVAKKATKAPKAPPPQRTKKKAAGKSAAASKKN